MASPRTVHRKNHRIRVITASVRTTNRMNALLNESMQSQKRRNLLAKITNFHNLTSSNNNNITNNKKDLSTDGEEIEPQRPRANFEYFKLNFTMDHVYNLIEQIIEERLKWDRFNRIYDSYKSVQLAESLAKEIKDRVKALNHQRYRIVCFLSVIEKQHQGVDMQMKFLLDEKLDNYITYIHERATYNIVATLFLIYKE